MLSCTRFYFLHKYLAPNRTQVRVQTFIKISCKKSAQISSKCFLYKFLELVSELCYNCSSIYNCPTCTNIPHCPSHTVCCSMKQLRPEAKCLSEVTNDSYEWLIQISVEVVGGPRDYPSFYTVSQKTSHFVILHNVNMPAPICIKFGRLEETHSFKRT